MVKRSIPHGLCLIVLLNALQGFVCARMGNLIKVLSRDIDNNAGNFFLDFESKIHACACTIM